MASIQEEDMTADGLLAYNNQRHFSNITYRTHCRPLFQDSKSNMSCE